MLSAFFPNAVTVIRHRKPRNTAPMALHLGKVKMRLTWRTQLSDAADEMVLEAAVNGRADALPTHNVGRLLPEGSRRWRKR